MREPPKSERVPKTFAEAETAVGGAPERTLDNAEAVPAAVAYAAPPVVLSSRYEVLGELGKGGMGIVYKARDRETSELLALKVLRPEIAGREELAERFVSELRLARQITHKNVCRIYDFNRIGEVACISMELVEGESLRHVLERFGNLSVRTSTRIATQICAALREAHAQGIVHRDMKPENVMLDARGEVKVMDFGIAQSMKSGGDEPEISGTPAYMSPEQAQGQPTDARTDVYAAGMILYEMLSGRLPFKGKTTLELARRGEPLSPQPLRELEPTVPPHLDRVAMRCLEHDPQRRYQTIAELETALRSETASEMEAFDLAAPAHLQRSNWVDAMLVLAAVAGLILFFFSRGTILPATRDKLQSEAVTARREAERVLKQSGYAGANTAATLEFRADDYRRRVYSALDPLQAMVARGQGGPTDTFSRLRAVALPLFWRVDFGALAWVNPGDEGGHVLLNREGRAIEYVRRVQDSARYLPQYKPAALEERRRIATAAAEQFCGYPLKEPPRTELAGGDSGASYTAVWQPLNPPGSLPVARVVLWAEAPFEVACAQSFAAPMGSGMVSGIEMVGRSFHTFGFFVVTGLMIGLLFRFAVGRYQESPLMLRRAPLALLLGGATAWTGQVEWLGGVPSLPLTLAASLVAALMWLVAIVTIEHRLLRYAPEKLAAWSALLRGRVLAPEVGMGLLRGTCIGLGLLGVQAGLAYWTLSHPRSLMLGVPDPSVAVNGVATTLPALYTVGAVLTSTFTCGFVAAGMTMVLRARWIHKKRRVSLPTKIVGGLLIGYLAIGFASVVVYTLRLAFGQTLSGMILTLVPGFMLALVCLAILRYDLLTATFAVATATLFAVNSTVLWLLEDLSNATQTGLFIGWGAIVLLGTYVAFRQQVVSAIQRAKTEMA